MLKLEKQMKILELYYEVDDPIFKKFFDDESENMLDEKIEVMTALIEGKTPSEIPNYYDVLERMPKDKNEIWD